uniref:Complement C4B (Chido/Rodgers blood group) n=1 Tax=Paramormyrops kingsleyae TaxID=1676925 RepID=A0A3B3SW33_9TELE
RGSAVCLSPLAKWEFLVTAPSVFHLGVRERVSVQLLSDLQQPVSLYLEHETSGMLMSNKASCQMAQRGETGFVELEVHYLSLLPKASPRYLMLVCEIRPGQRDMVRVLVSEHRGYIFIQTDQPVYSPTQSVNYRIFTLDHAMRPHEEFISFAVLMLMSLRPGIWKIVAHYLGDEKNAANREFRVQKFVMPSFDVSVVPEESYFLETLKEFNFTIYASYSYGKKVKGAFHCRFGVRDEAAKETEKPSTAFIRGLQKTGSVSGGRAEILILTSQLKHLLAERGANLTQLALDRVQLHIAVSVTDSASGELQEAELFLPMVSRRFSVDLSRTRSHFIPGVPLRVSVLVRLPNGSPAANIPVRSDVPRSSDLTRSGFTDQEGALHSTFNNIPVGDQPVTITVTVDDGVYEKIVYPSMSQSKSYLYMDVSPGVVSLRESVSIDFTVIGGKPRDGRIYYLVSLRWYKVKSVARSSILVGSDLIPSFRVIGYYYNQAGDIIADSLWVDVKDVCEGKSQHTPGSKANLDIELEGQKAKVALLAVDKAIYALNAQNKLTPKQVFASMESYDLGCSYGGGWDTADVFNDAGLSFISHPKAATSRMRKGFGCESGFRRQKRSLDLQQFMMSKVLSYESAELQRCCQDGFTLIPMKRTCEERASRVSQTGGGAACATAFLDCCREGNAQRKRMRAQRTHGRSELRPVWLSSIYPSIHPSIHPSLYLFICLFICIIIARQHFQIDGLFPNSTIPESPTNIFARIEGEVFGQSTALPLLSPAGVQALLTAPMGCAEQTMIRMTPTALALRYLDHSQGWVELPPGSRDVALSHVENGYSRILIFRKSDGSYGAWTSHPSSNWLTALVVKVMSLVVDRQLEGRGEKGREEIGISQDEIQKSVEYLISKQDGDGSFKDPNPVIHREMQVMISNGQVAHLKCRYRSELQQRPLLVIGTSSFKQQRECICNSACLTSRCTLTLDECRVWHSKSDTRLQNEERHRQVPPPEAITVETTGYALLAALANKDLEWADSAACWLSKQENYGGGFRSTQDTIVALEALSELAISRPPQAPSKMEAKFSVSGRSQTEKLTLEKKGDRVQVELKRLLGATINAELTGNGKAKLKVVKAYHVLEPVESCELLSIKVTMEGKVQYTEYSDVEDGNGDRRDEGIPRSEIDWFDARSRRRRDTEQSDQNAVVYSVCVSHHPSRNLSGMAVADITLLSGFQAQREDLDKSFCLRGQKALLDFVVAVCSSDGDISVGAGSVRVFAKRRHCKGQLDLDQIYLIMGQDGGTKDTNGEMQYLLDSSTWVEKLPEESKCKASANRIFCRDLDNFLVEYQTNGCTQ